ncbi:tetratricopeptide repeat protein [Oceanibaculum pacificum]|uniref:tetratricopeptide repeat protein n=1 Tax=Oceanibaculum pacificum TaxID=580166 RepID=UPI000A07A0D5|nr:tetratricopeptide repeat protein [Oceanibaculum pacificum]
MASAAPEFPPFLAELPVDEPRLLADTATPDIDAALALREAGLEGAALDRLIAALRREPGNAEAHLLAGETLLALGRSPAAAERFARVIALDPGALRLRQFWAEALAQSGRPAAAIAAYEHLLRLRPGHRQALKAQASLLAVTGEPDRAIARYRELTLLDRDDAEALTELGRLLVDRDAAPDAVPPLQRALRLDPARAEAQHHLGRAWALLGEPAKAAQSLERACDLDPDDRLGSRAALEALAQAAGMLPASYVRDLFDQYAPGFDTALMTRLDYRGPALLRRALDRLLGLPQPLSILDIGCGTGLVGRELRPFARLLEGVDLAPRMIEQAARTGLYDALHVGDAVPALQDGRSWDVIVAGDVLVYLGDLAPLITAVAAALTPGGLFLATAESLPEGIDAPFHLKPTRRFGHGEGYVARLAGEQGLSVALIEPAAIRLEKKQPVRGFVFALARR